MNQKLDFIVFGVPRSGTTAAARYLSAANNVYCGVECFTHKIDHAGLRAPECFLRNPVLEEGSPNLRRSREDIAAKGERIRLYGNKLPTYFLRLQGVLDEIARPRALLCYRDIGDVAQSYATRANLPGDTWPQGRHGIFAAGDMVVMLKALSELARGEVMVIPYSAVLKDWPATFTEALQFLDPALEPNFDTGALRDIEAQHEKVANRLKPDLSPMDQRAVDRVRRSGAHDLLERDAPYLLSEVAADLPAVLEKLPRNPVNWVARLAREHPVAATRDFLPIWQQRVRKPWKAMTQEAAA